MNDKDLLTTLLSLTKSLNMLYINGTIESSNESVRKTFEDGLKETLKLQNNLYNFMVDKGYYDISNVKETDVNKLYNKLKKSS